MASSDEFKRQLKAGNFAKAFAIAFSETIELKITTWVSTDSDDPSSTVAKPGHRLHTRINMIEGDIENEVGEQFIGNNPYKELRQFHLEQVAQGNEIIQSNLKSLQKLFEVLVMRKYQTATTPVIEPQSSGVANQLLPPVEPISTTRITPQPTQTVIEESPITADTVIEELTDSQLSMEPTQTVMEESGVIANTAIEEELSKAGVEQNNSAAVEASAPVARIAIEEEVSQEQPSGSQLDSLAEPPIAIPEASDSETVEEDWDDSVLDFMESLPVESPSTPEESGSDLATEDSQLSQNSVNPTLEELNSPSASPEQEIGVSELELDGDWDDWVIEETNILPDAAVSDQSLLELQEEYDDWDDWVVEEPSNLTDVPVDEGLSSDLGTDEDWDLGEYSDPFAEQPTINGSMSALDINEDWDEFVVEEEDNLDFSPKPVEKRQPPSRFPKQDQDNN